METRPAGGFIATVSIGHMQEPETCEKPPPTISEIAKKAVKTNSLEQSIGPFRVGLGQSPRPTRYRIGRRFPGFSGPEKHGAAGAVRRD